MTKETAGFGDADLAFLRGGGEMGARMRAKDWSTTPLGPPQTWPQSLKTTIRILLDSRYAMWMGWGPELVFFCNDAYLPTVGNKQSWVLGSPASAVWAEIWPEIGPRIQHVLTSGEATWDEGLLLFLERSGYPEETYHTFSYSPLYDDAGKVGGHLCVVTEETERVIGERRLGLLRELAAGLAAIKTEGEAFAAIQRAVAPSSGDLPFTLLYLFDSDGKTARLACATGLNAREHPLAPKCIAGDTVWPLNEVHVRHEPVLVKDLRGRFGDIPGGPWDISPEHALVVLLSQQGQRGPSGILVAGLNPHRSLDSAYRGFIDLFAGQISAGLANAHAYEEERRRAEALAELDRAKTAFFSNVSHEFRTPLTLMLGPLQDLLDNPAAALLPEDRESLQIMRRNGQRLLKLVNTLLQFSRIEAGRMQAAFGPVDLAASTAELASVFRSATEKAGLRLIVDCPPLPEPVFVDRDLWEKIVLNLLSNAFKYTLHGEIEIALHAIGRAAVLRVRDTGTGIPAEELPRLFDRFYRVEGAHGRTHEGTGIGLSLVKELVSLHGGAVSAESEPGKGSTFTVTIPLGKGHLPQDRISDVHSLRRTSAEAPSFVEEALHWLPGAYLDAPSAHAVSEVKLSAVGVTSGKVRSTILLVDDNRDMREYVQRLLSGRFEVITAGDGREALAICRDHLPDLVLTDVMMPGLDGFGLLKALRTDPMLALIPVIMLSARAGEEARAEGLQAGADDYLVKPFSARELISRVDATLTLAQFRRETSIRIEERFREMADHAPVMIWVTDSQGLCTFLNKSWYDFTGQTPATGLNAGRLDAIHPEDRQSVKDTFVMRNARREAFRMEYRLRQANGDYRWALDIAAPHIASDGRFLGYIGSVIDITDRKRIEEASRKQTQRLRLLWDAAGVLLAAERPDAMLRDLFEKISPHFGLDAYFNFIVDETGEALRLASCFGIPEETAQSIRRLEFGQAICGNVALRRSPIVATFIQNSDAPQTQLVKGLGIRAYACNPLMADNRLLGTLSFASRVRDQFDAEELEFLRTVTNYVTVAYERSRLLGELREADRRKDEFLATLAHELRNPLAPIRNALEIMQLCGDDRRILDDSRRMMERQLHQMVRLVDDLLEVSRISRGKVELRRERAELRSILQSAMEISRPLIDQAGLDLAVELPAHPIRVDADITRLAQVFANLLNNAAKYTPRGGHIRLRVTPGIETVEVSIKDDGIGIPAPMLSKVFDLFTQVDRSLEKSQGGLGIGLTIVKRLVEMHGGSVEARSDGPGTGSEFIVKLPILKASNGSVKLAESTPSAGTRRRILVVDDNLDAAKTLSMMLRLLGHEMRTVHDGEAAVQEAEAFLPEVMLLDIGLPKRNGYDVARHLRNQAWGRGIFLVALTGWGQEDDKRRAVEAGFNHHFTKPVDPAALQQLLANISHSSSL